MISLSSLATSSSPATAATRRMARAGGQPDSAADAELRGGEQASGGRGGDATATTSPTRTESSTDNDRKSTAYPAVNPTHATNENLRASHLTGSALGNVVVDCGGHGWSDSFEHVIQGRMQQVAQIRGGGDSALDWTVGGCCLREGSNLRQTPEQQLRAHQRARIHAQS
jgi:hypothetical protein